MGVGAHVCALGPEGACVHAAVGERTVAPPVFRAFGRRRAFAGGVPAFFGPDSARYHTPDKANVLYLFLGQELKPI